MIYLGKLISIIKKNKILLIILIIATTLRFVGINPGYNQYHADEGISYSAATSMVKNGNFDPLRYDYPALVPLTNYIFFKFIFIPVKWFSYYINHASQIIDGIVHIPIAPLEAKRIFQLFVLGERDRNALFWGRYVTAFFSLGIVFLTYVVAKKLFNQKIGLIAAFLITFNFKNVINAHIGLPDIYNAFFLLVVFLASINLWKKPSSKNYLIGGIAIGLSFSVKYQFFCIFPFLLAHFYISLERSKINFKKLFNSAIFLSGAVALLTILIINPYHVAFLQRTISIVSDVSKKYGMGTKKIDLYPFWYFYHIDYGPVEFFLIFIGLLVSLKKFFRTTLFFISFLIPFCFIFFYYSAGGFYVRNFITITPLLLTFAAVAIWTAYDFSRRKINSKISNILLVIFLILTIYLPGRNAIISSYYYTKPWNYAVMATWIKQNIPANATVAAHPFDAPNIGLKNKRTEFEVTGAYSLNEHLEDGDQYAIMNLNWASSPFYFWMSFGFNRLGVYWNKPIDLMRNTFHGIAAEELFRYQIYAVLKPWQTPDTDLIVAKLPVWPKVEMNNIVNYNFNNGLEGWTLHGKQLNDGGDYILDSKTGHETNGSVGYIPSSAEVPIARITSNLIPIKEGHLYNISGFLKTEINLEAHERDGFIRVDFYGNNPDIEKVGITSAVSSRVFGTTDWVKKEITERAPTGSKYLTVSFQTYITTRTKIWLDDVSVNESKDVVEDITSKPPYNIMKIDLDTLYLNSHGNL